MTTDQNAPKEENQNLPLIVALGLNYQTAPVELREIFACNPSEEGFLKELPYLANIEGVREVVILSTCNRVEIYAVVDSEETIKKLLKEFVYLKTGKEPTEDIFKHFFIKTGKEAIEHILSIPAGIKSMVVGENQIVSQFKEAFEIAKKHKTVGKILNKLYEEALKTSKKVRNQTNIGKTPVSVSYVAVILAKKIFGDLENVKVLLLGAGEMARLTALYLKREKAKIWVSNRTFEKALALAKDLGASVIKWEEFKEFLKEVDMVIVSTGAKDYIIKAAELEKIFRKKSSPTVFIDISVPRNVEPSVGELPNVFLFNIDDLKEIADKNLLERKKEAEKAQIIVAQQTEKFLRWLENLYINDLLREINILLDLLKVKSLQGSPERDIDTFLKRLKYPLFKVLKRDKENARLFLEALREVLNNLSKERNKERKTEES